MSEELAGLRAEIDDIDAQIVTLIGRRRAVSALIQRSRLDDGGGPVDPARERAVLAGYATPLGPAGRTLAAAVLDCCRRPPGGTGPDGPPSSANAVTPQPG